MPYLRQYDRAPLIQPILYKTAFYWVVVFFARLLKRFVHFSIEGNSPADFIPYLSTTFSWHRFTAISLWIFVLFPDLCDGIGNQSSFWSRRAAAAVFHLSSVGSPAQSATADPRAIAAERPCRRSFHQ
jgi:hypothetical protein